MASSLVFPEECFALQELSNAARTRKEMCRAASQLVEDSDMMKTGSRTVQALAGSGHRVLSCASFPPEFVMAGGEVRTGLNEVRTGLMKMCEAAENDPTLRPALQERWPKIERFVIPNDDARVALRGQTGIRAVETIEKESIIRPFQVPLAT